MDNQTENIYENYSLSLEFNRLPKMPNALLGAHWTKRAKEAKDWKQLVYLAVRGRLPLRPLVRVRLHLERHSSAEPDYDGLVGSFKPVIDALVKVGVLEDDRMKNIESTYQWEYAPAREGRITIEVMNLKCEWFLLRVG